MELHSFDGMPPVPKPHDRTRAVFFGRPRADLEFPWQVFLFDNQRVVASSRHGHRKSLKDSPVVMKDGAGLAVHEVRRPNHMTAKCFADRLMSQADTEQRGLAGKVADQFDADAGFVRRARPWRDDDPVWLHRLDLVYRDLVVAAHLDLLAQFTNVLNQVVGERIVVVEDEYHRNPLLRSAYTKEDSQTTSGDWLEKAGWQA